MPRRQKGPAHRLAFANPISPSTPFLFLPSSRQYTAPAGLRARTRLGEGTGFLLARRKMRWRSEDTCLSNESCELCPQTSPLAFFWELRGTLPESREASAPGGPSARNSHHYEPLPKKRKKPPRQITPPERFSLFSPTN